MITPIAGAEVISGSTRMKAGTATKMVLNMLTTGRNGSAGEDLQFDGRFESDQSQINGSFSSYCLGDYGSKESESRDLLGRCDNEVKTAIVALLSIDAQAREKLQRTDGHLRNALESTS